MTVKLYACDRKITGWQWCDQPSLAGCWFGLLRDSDEFERFLASRPYLRGLIPAVEDWRAHLLVVAALGEAPTGGYAVRIREIVRLNGALKVVVYLRSPAPDDFVFQTINYPVDSVHVPRDRVPAGLPWIFIDQNGRLLARDVL
jgi:hypothetical protein